MIPQPIETPVEDSRPSLVRVCDGRTLAADGRVAHYFRKDAAGDWVCACGEVRWEVR